MEVQDALMSGSPSIQWYYIAMSPPSRRVMKSGLPRIQVLLRTSEIQDTGGNCEKHRAPSTPAQVRQDETIRKHASHAQKEIERN